MGGKSRSSSASSSVTNVDTRNVNLDGVEGIAVAGSEGTQINIIDGGAIQMAQNTIDGTFGAVGEVLDFVENINADSINAVSKSSDSAIDTVTKNMISSFDKINESNQSDQSAAMKNITQGVMVLAAFYAATKIWGN